MGELIRREAAAKPLDFSGERLTAAISGQVEIEHYHRYLLAREYCRGLDVLDCASGEGYGSALLAQVARSVVGVEIDQRVVEAARAEFTQANLSFQQGDARELPLADASVDVAVSFETLEHLFEQDQFLSELRRVLRPTGLLIISTPDRDIYSPLGTAPNPFHKLELTRLEFEALLRRHFSHALLAGQRALIGSVILTDEQHAPARSFERRGESHIEGSDHLARATYLFALASNVPPPALRNSVYVYRNDLDTDTQVRFQAEIGRRAAEKAASEAGTRAIQVERLLAASEERAAQSQAREQEAASVIAELQRTEKLLQAQIGRVQHLHSNAEADATDLRQRGEALESQLAQASARADQAEHNLTETRNQLAAASAAREAAAAAHDTARQQASDLSHRLARIENSSIWRGSYPVRQFGSKVPILARGVRVGAKVVWWTGTLQLPARYRLWRDNRALRLKASDGMEVARPPALLPPADEPPSLTVSPAANVATTDIALPHSREPAISIIISTYGQLAATLACLKSIWKHPPSMPTEVIVVDDSYSGPEDMRMLQEIPGMLLLRNAVNLGFVLSCNQAARAAKGRYIYMLNNDTEVQPGAIDALVNLLEARPDIGMAGSKLLFPDGRLQEAGGILWTDATGWNYGRGEDPDRPDFTYLREVDYCSGASIMVRRDLFESLGGFDPEFAPAYYEDADLAFRIRRAGYKVVYEPRSVIIHHEGLSHGTDMTAGIKAHQVVNQATMLARWGETLARESFESGQHVMRARDRARTRKTILVLEHYVLEPDRDAGSRSTMGIINSLIDDGWVVKFWPLNRAYSPIYTPALQQRGIEVLDHRWPGNLEAWMRQNGAELDHVLVVRPDTAVATLPFIMANTDAVLSFYGVDLHFARTRRQALLDGNLDRMREAASLERLERRVWRNFDVVIYPSEDEAQAVREMSPTSMVCGIVAFCFDTLPPKTAPAGDHNILFVAGFAHPPNVDAALFLISEIIPRLEARIGPVKVTLAGSNPTEEVRSLAGKDVVVTGYVTDEQLYELYAAHRASVVPLRFGAGVKGKVVESLSRGLPLVTTSTGAQGIEGLSDIVPVHDDPAALAEALGHLLTDDVAWLQQSNAQTAFAAKRYSRAAMRSSVLQAFQAGETAATAARRHRIV